MMRRYGWLSIFATWLTFSSLWGQSTDFFPFDEVRPGLKGKGRTVFQGTQPEEFDVEILGVIGNQGPKQKVVMARLSGPNIERYGVYRGISGSPVYIDGKLLGAVAYAFSFATEPIAGITPIQETVAVFEQNPPTSFKLAKRLRLSQLYEVSRLRDLFRDKNPFFSPITVGGSLARYGSLQPIATPLSFNGFAAGTIEAFSPTLESFGMAPVAGSSLSELNDLADAPLEPGSTITVQMLRGDLDVSASGTVTHISGDRVYAFGHPFLGIGSTSMPMNKGGVVTIIPSLAVSEKISVSGRQVGSIDQDRATGILGYKGTDPKMVPVELKLLTSREETLDYQFEIVNDSFLTPFLLTLAVHNSIITSERAIGGQTLNIQCEIDLEGHQKINFENNISDPASSPALAAVAASSPVHFLLNSGFENIEMKNIRLEISAVEQTREATLARVWQDELEVRAGQELNLTVFLRRGNGEVLTESYPIKIPEDVQRGPLKIFVGDGIAATLTSALADREFIPRDVGQLVRAINNLKKNDRLYVRLFRNESGAIVAGQGLPGLPPSLNEIYNSKKTSGDAEKIDQVVYVEHELPATDYVIKGHQILTVEVIG